MPNVVAYGNQTVQIGQETTANTPVACGKRLQSTIIAQGEETQIKTFRPQGRRFDAYTEPETNHIIWDASGDVLYTELLYLIEAAFGAVAPSTPGGGTTSKQRDYTVNLTGPHTPKTFTQQWGDSTHAYQNAGNVCSSIGMKYDREGGVVLDSCSGFGQDKSDTTLTASPGVLALQPILGGHVNYYLDTTGAGIGGTQVDEEILDAGWKISGLYVPFWASDRSQTSYKRALDDGSEAQSEVSLTIGESTTARTFVGNMTLGQTYFLRIDAQGPVIEASINYRFRTDLAVRLTKKQKWGNTKKIYARGLTFTIVEDVTWGKAAMFSSITNEGTL